MSGRKSGILLHITSLPSPYGIGDLGPQAYKFVDFLSRSGQKVWQILPLNEIVLTSGNSPYHSLSAFAGNSYLISPDLLVKDKWIRKKDLQPKPEFSEDKVDYAAVYDYKNRLFAAAFENFKKKNPTAKYIKFCADNSDWLDDFALFKALRIHFEYKSWSRWPREIRDRDKNALKKISDQLADLIEKEKFLQYIFCEQWSKLRAYCRKKKILIFGDLPIYIEYDSVDVWVNPEIFRLNEKREPFVVSGVPPDYFSATGQLWGHPLFNWETLKQRGFSWWIKRLGQNLKRYDMVRVDHFRGLVGYWEIKAGEKTAMSGRWVKAPAEEFFSALLKNFPKLPIVAEDLGVITPDVTKIMSDFNIPGMRVLLFAFGDDNPWHPYLPENFVPNCVVYTGTHDTNTARGWIENEASAEEKARLFKYLGREVSAQEIPWELIKLAERSKAKIAILPMQDILGLGEEARMNRPAKAEGNWLWRVLPGQLGPSTINKLFKLTKKCRRSV